MKYTFCVTMYAEVKIEAENEDAAYEWFNSEEGQRTALDELMLSSIELDSVLLEE